MYTCLSKIALILCNCVQKPVVISQLMNDMTICFIYVLFKILFTTTK